MILIFNGVHPGMIKVCKQTTFCFYEERFIEDKQWFHQKNKLYIVHVLLWQKINKIFSGKFLFFPQNTYSNDVWEN